MRNDGINKWLKAGAMVSVLFLLAGCEENCCDSSDTSPPAVPSGVYTITGDEQVTVCWSPVIEDDFDYYVVWRSNHPAGPYSDIGTTEDDVFVDVGLVNGHTYFYSVSSVDRYGNESDLSYELVYDTPRPEGSSSLMDYSNYPNNSGFSFSSEQVVRYNDEGCDIYLEYDDNAGLFFINVGRQYTDIQDFGYTDDLDDVNYAPPDGWSSLGYVEVIMGHSYIVWTADDHYAKFRITNISTGNYTVEFDYAYQVDGGNRELRLPPGEKIEKTVLR
jgi:hypothetical protein